MEPLAHGSICVRTVLGLVEYDHGATIFGARHTDWYESVDRVDVAHRLAERVRGGAGHGEL